MRPAMSGFRLPADVLKAWKDQLGANRGAADDALQDILRALQGEGPDGHVVVTRHQLFSWAQAVEGASLKGRPQLKAVADDMRSYLRAGESAPAPAAAPAPAFVAPIAPPPAATYAPRAEPPPVVYQRVATPTAGLAMGSSRLVTERELAGFVLEMLREARTEVVVVSPWGLGLDTLANALLNLPPGVAVRALTRRPPTEDEPYHRTMQQFRRRGFDIVFSPNLQTRLVVTDGQRLLLGAASVPGPQSREAAIATTDAALVQAARENALRLMDEARVS